MFFGAEVSIQGDGESPERLMVAIGTSPCSSDQRDVSFGWKADIKLRSLPGPISCESSTSRSAASSWPRQHFIDLISGHSG